MARVPVTCSVEANQIFYYITPRFLPGAPSCANSEGLSGPRGLYTLPRGGSVYPLAICLHSQTYWKSKWGDRRGPGHRVLRALAQTGAVKQLMGLLDIHMQSVDADRVCLWQQRPPPVFDVETYGVTGLMWHDAGIHIWTYTNLHPKTEGQQKSIAGSYQRDIWVPYIPDIYGLMKESYLQKLEDHPKLIINWY